MHTKSPPVRYPSRLRRECWRKRRTAGIPRRAFRHAAASASPAIDCQHHPAGQAKRAGKVHRREVSTLISRSSEARQAAVWLKSTSSGPSRVILPAKVGAAGQPLSAGIVESKHPGDRARRASCSHRQGAGVIAAMFLPPGPDQADLRPRAPVRQAAGASSRADLWLALR